MEGGTPGDVLQRLARGAAGNQRLVLCDLRGGESLPHKQGPLQLGPRTTVEQVRCE